MFAECCVFAKQSDGPFHCARDKSPRDPFSRSYGARLPSSLTGFHSCALVYSTHPPVSVYGTGSLVYALELFLADSLRDPLHPKDPSQLAPLPLSAGRLFPNPRPSSLNQRRCWNINQLSIAYALRPRLRSRLTLIRLALIRKP